MLYRSDEHIKYQKQKGGAARSQEGPEQRSSSSSSSEASSSSGVTRGARWRWVVAHALSCGGWATDGLIEMQRGEVAARPAHHHRNHHHLHPEKMNE